MFRLGTNYQVSECRIISSFLISHKMNKTIKQLELQFYVVNENMTFGILILIKIFMDLTVTI